MTGPSHLTAAAALLLALAGPGLRGAEEVTYERDVAPLLARRCTFCHGIDDEKGQLDLTSLELIIQGGKSGPALVAGKSGESVLVDRISRTDGKVMPPRNSGKPLSAEEIALIRRWIDGGAVRGTAIAPAAGTREGTPGAATLAGPARAPIAAVAFSSDEALLALGSETAVTIIDAASGKSEARLEGHAELVRSLAWSPLERKLAAAGGLPAGGGEVLIWAAPAPGESAWSQAGAIRAHADAIHAVAWTRDGTRIATASYDRLIKLWDAATLKETATLKDHLDAVFSLAFTPDGRHLASASADRGLKLWEAATGKRLFTLSDATLGLNSVTLSPNGLEVAAAGQDRMVRIWRLQLDSPAEGVLSRSFFAHEGAVLRAVFSPDGKSLYTAGEDGLLKAWQTESLSERLVFEKQPDWVLDLAVRADGKAIAAGRYDGSWAVYDTEKGTRILPREKAARSRPVAAAVNPTDPGPNLTDPGPNLTDPAPNPTDPAQAAEARGGEDAAAGGAQEAEGKKRKKAGLLVDVVDAGNVTVPPSLGGHWPRASSRGKTVRLAIDGKNLAGAEIAFLEPGFEARVVKNDALPRPEFRRIPGNTGAEIVDLSVPHKLEVDVEIAPGARPGLHSFLALTPAGATNALSIFVEHREEGNEAEPNDALAAATPLPPEVIAGTRVLLGSMNQSGDADLFRFEAREGQELVFHILSSSIGSGLNALLAVLGPDGQELATSAAREFGNRVEGRVAHRFAQAGPHYLRITDKNFGAGGFYRLYAGELPFVTSFFPPGLQRGTSAEIAVRGFNIGKDMRVRVEAPAEAGPEATVPLPVAGALQGGNAAVGDAPEVREAEPNDEPAAAQPVAAPLTVNGVLAAAAAGGTDADCFRFQARKGETYIIDVVASRLGSLLDSFIEVLDGEGRPVERATLRCVAQTLLTLSDRDAQSPGLRLETWSDLRVNDLVMVGSEVLKVRLLPDYADEDVLFFDQQAARTGFLDTTPEFHAVGEAIYKVEVHPPRSEFPPNGMPVFHLAYRNDDGGMPVHGKDSRLHFAAPADGEYVIRIRDVQGPVFSPPAPPEGAAALSRGEHNGEDFYYRLQVRQPRPDFHFYVNASNLNIPRGSRVPFSVAVERLDDFAGEIAVELAEPLPPGFRFDAAPILGDQYRAILTVAAGAETESTPLGRTFRLLGKATIAGKEITREGRLGMLRVTGNPDLVIGLHPQGEQGPLRELKLEPGGTAAMVVRAVRQNGFAGRIPIEIPNLPHGVVVMNTGLNDILIPEHEEARVVELHAEPWVRPLRRTIYAIGRTETTSPLPTQFASEPAVLVIGDAPAVAAQPEF